MEPKGESTEPTKAELESAAAEFLGEPQPEPEAAPSEPAQEGEAETVPGEAPSESPTDPYTELRESLKDTPYYKDGKDIKEVVAELNKGYKELTTRFNAEREKVKPHEQLLSLLEKDPNARNFLTQAAHLYQNPHLASAYVNPSGNVNTRPDPRRYDMYDQAQAQQYEQDLEAYMARQLDERLNTRLSGLEAQQKLEIKKLDFKKQFPDVDVESILTRAQNELSGQNELILAYKALNYDNLASQMLERARKDLGAKLEEAGKTKTPTASAPAKSVNISDIIKAIHTLGPKAAEKQYGKKRVEEALRESVSSL